MKEALFEAGAPVGADMHPAFLHEPVVDVDEFVEGAEAVIGHEDENGVLVEGVYDGGEVVVYYLVVIADSVAIFGVTAGVVERVLLIHIFPEGVGDGVCAVEDHHSKVPFFTLTEVVEGATAQCGAVGKVLEEGIYTAVGVSLAGIRIKDIVANGFGDFLEKRGRMADVGF